jgi:hypothetical protein
MKRETFSKTDLNQIQRQLSAWRRRKTGRSRIPDDLWIAATELAKIHGTGLVARVLRLDYYKLRERVCGMGPSLPGAAFVEVKGAELASMGPEESVIELSDGGGGRMSLRVRADLSMLTALVQSFWRRTP